LSTAPISEENNTTFFYDVFVKNIVTPPFVAYNIALFYDASENIVTLPSVAYTTAFFHGTFIKTWSNILLLFLSGKVPMPSYVAIPEIAEENTTTFSTVSPKINFVCCLLPLSAGALSLLQALLLSYYPFFPLHHDHPVIFSHTILIVIASHHRTCTQRIIIQNHGVDLFQRFFHTSNYIVL
jgi:hypothetical protein